MPETPEQRLAELGFELPPPFPPAGSYIPATQTGNLLILSGHVPITTEGRPITGKLGADLDLPTGRHAARLAALSALATMRTISPTGLNAIQRVISLRGLVNATPEFTEHTQVIDAASDLFTQIFGPAGKHARLAIGVTSLPANLALEIELTAELSPTP